MFMPDEGRESECRDPNLSKPHKYSTVAILKGFYPYFFNSCPGHPEKHACVCMLAVLMQQLT
jgi:hypothetical protein